ncbi:PLP-dependent aminotransferase family protein [Anabaena sp. FACHB-709]|uniref:Transcriptional regulator n=2 Tax=Nostocaceae TaxID=1162 RepID=A0A1Z4KN07_ANAVA|nr:MULTISPECIES: PLP-dependent aminotransferase family protein [Nostocaceae]BAY70346.1 transcriptional regulator [Trichormus variabilis NIES-23]HBW30736.1 PLP-dependent aminotransferase family protein [Nostoc sp. UBA8866]MBD2173517.1 PLP-dependent aminotransferase family protein [Anabaena cylindrica FACHB-318]MBD2265174.1 PLP-dependent aminotransferase family protein [Anabaena sp. FACHB-709]MBD2274578.1 PLP-dependent aminotransferase family protein [Nostoc sp. PCC 7120 = FACHB-418]
MDFAINIDPDAPLPLHRQVYEELRRAILLGRLTSGGKLPSTRSLAQLLGVSRATVTQGYELLLSEGYLETIVGSGTFVCRQLPDELLNTAPIESKLQPSNSLVPLSAYGKSLSDKAFLRIPEQAVEISFSYGRPAFDQFPIDLWRKLISRHCHSKAEVLDYTDNSLGYQPLREAIAAYLSRSRAVNCQAEQIIIVGGSQQGLDLITRILIDPNDGIAVEEPGYLGARRAFLAQGASLFPVPVDQSGLIVSKLTTGIIPKLKLIYVTPSHQFPTGAVLSLPRRLELLAWAHKTGVMIIEDDYDSEYRYGERPIPALQGLDQGNSVVYVGTFSKVLFPALRLGYLVLPQNLVNIFARAKWLADRQCSLLEQYALTDFITEGHLERHIRRMRSLYNQRRQTLVQSLFSHFGNRAKILGENAGMHLMVKIDTQISDDEIVQSADLSGVSIGAAYPQYLKDSPGSEFIFGYAELNEQQIQEGVRRLARVIHNLEG